MQTSRGKKRCPICKNGVEVGSPTAPFCSERCKLIDLGNWVSEGYRIPDDDEVEPDDERGSKE